MANRTVSVALRMLIGDYIPPAEKAAQVTDKIGDSAAKAAATHKRGMQAITLGAGVAATAGALALHKIVSASMDFQQAMSDVGAVSDASAGDLQRLSDAAIKAGADTSFSATEAAQAEAELAKAGVSTSDILGGALTGSLSLAAAGHIDLADAASISAQAMNIWKLSGSDVGHIADVLAAGATKSAADVDQLGQAMQQSGLVASQLGVGLEDTVGTLAAFADRALVGSDAGTSLKTMLQRLASPTTEASAEMQKLGIHAFDAGGKFVGMEALAGQLQSRLAGLTQEQRAAALSTIFGSDAIRAANVLFGLGAKGVHEYTAAVNDQGAAARMAAIQQDNLAGDVEKLSGSIDTALIKSGSGANTMLRGLTQTATGVVNAFSDAPGAVQATATGLLVVTTTGAGAIAMFGTLAPRVQAGRAALREMGAAGDFTDRSIGRVSRNLTALAGGAVAIGVVTTAALKLQDAVADTPQLVNELEGALLRASNAGDVLFATGSRALDDQAKLGESIRRLTEPSNQQKFQNFMTGLAGGSTLAFRNAKTQVDGLDKALSDLVSSGHAPEAERQFGLIVQAAAAGGASVDDVRKALPLYRDALAGAANSATLAADGTTKVGDAAAGAAGKIGGAAAPTTEYSDAQRIAAAETGKLTDAMLGEADATNILGGALDLISGNAMAVVSSQIAFRNSLGDLSKAQKENGSVVSQNSAAGRANAEAILSSMDAARRNAEAVTKQAEAQGKGAQAVAIGTAAYDKSVTAIRAAAIAAGFNKRQVDALITSVYKTPAQRGVAVTAPGARKAREDVEGLGGAAKKVPPKVSIGVTATTNSAEAALRQTTRPRKTLVTATSSVNSAEATLTRLVRGRRSTVVAVGSTNAAESAINRAARRRTSPVTAVSSTNAAESTLNRTSRSRRAQITATSSTNAAESAIDYAARPRNATIYVSTVVSSSTAAERGLIGRRASGGPVEAGTVYRVNESGAEGYFVPPADGYVLNHRDFARVLDGRSMTPAGPVTAGRGRGEVHLHLGPVNVTARPDDSPRRVGRRIADEVSDMLGQDLDLLLKTP